MSERVELLAGEAQKGEHRRAMQACNDWLRMGPIRTLTGLARHYRETPENSAPTRSLGTIGYWSKKYNWQSRADQYDARIEAEKNARAREIMNSGLSLVHERVNELQALADFLKGELYEKGEDGVFHNVWLPDVKQIGGGKYAERVDIERFNAALIEQFRDTLDDLAKETGGRAQKQIISNPDGSPLLPVSDLVAALRQAKNDLRDDA